MTTRSELWHSSLEEAKALVDGLGRKIDPLILETVAAFRMHGFPTSMSCEGHLDRGCPYPWVDFYTTAPEGWQDDENKKAEWTVSNLDERGRLLKLLAEFYQDRGVPYDTIVSFRNKGMFGAFRLQSIGSELVATLPQKGQEKKLHLYREEMKFLTEFLKNKTPQG